MSRIEQVKAYEGRDLETIFFRPMLTGPDAAALGIKAMYNVPVPTTLHFWKRSGDVLQRYEHAGWKGGPAASRYQKTVRLEKVKAEASYTAEDYFSLVYELVTNRPDVNLDDLTGTELEAAETSLFRQAVAESIRVTMWLGDRGRAAGPYNTFDGFLRRITADAAEAPQEFAAMLYERPAVQADALLQSLWDSAPEELRQSRGQGSLAYLVTSDIYAAYENNLDAQQAEAAYFARQEGYDSLSYKGIPITDTGGSPYLEGLPDMPRSFALLTDRRNLALAVNTRDFPGTEVRMWYNPDLMENRQRAIFMAGCDYLLPEMLCVGFGRPTVTATLSGTAVTAAAVDGGCLVKGIAAQALGADGAAVGEPAALTRTAGGWSGTLGGSAPAGARLTVDCVGGSYELVI